MGKVRNEIQCGVKVNFSDKKYLPIKFKFNTGKEYIVINGVKYDKIDLYYIQDNKHINLYFRLKRVVKGRHWLDRYYFYPAPNNKYKYIRITL